MQTYILLALGFAVGRAVVTIAQKFISEYIENDWKSFSLIFYFSGILFSGLLYIISPWQVNIQTFKAVFPASFFFLIGGVSFYYSLFHEDASIIGGLQPLKLIFVAVLANIFLGESFSVFVYLMIGVMVLSSFLVVVDEDIELSDFFNLPMAVNLFSLFCFAISDVFIKKSYSVLAPLSFMSCNLFISAFLSLFLLFLIGKDVRKITLKQIRSVSINAWMTFAVVLLLILAFETNVTISNAISNLTGPFVLIFTILIGKMRPHLIEDHTRKVYVIRLCGTVLSYLAAVGIVLSI